MMPSRSIEEEIRADLSSSVRRNGSAVGGTGEQRRGNRRQMHGVQDPTSWLRIHAPGLHHGRAEGQGARVHGESARPDIIAEPCAADGFTGDAASLLVRGNVALLGEGKLRASRHYFE